MSAAHEMRVMANGRQFDANESIRSILPEGNTIHGYSSANNRRMLMVLESRRYSDSAPLLGFGVDGTAERALGRSILTYVKREELGLSYITEGQLPESTSGQVAAGRCSSKFDHIVWASDFWLFQEGGEFVAGSSYGRVWGGRDTEVVAKDALSAIIKLADNCRVANSEDPAGHLPPISFV